MCPGSTLPSKLTHLKPWGCVQDLRLSSTSTRCLVACLLFGDVLMEPSCFLRSLFILLFLHALAGA